MHSLEVRTQVSGYIDQNKNNRENQFLSYIKKAFHEGKLDHNLIRKAMIDCYRKQDKTAVLFGSLLLQLDNHEIHDLLREKILKN